MHIHLLLSFPWIKTLHRRGEGSDQQNVPIILCDVFHLFSMQIECYVPSRAPVLSKLTKRLIGHAYYPPDWAIIIIIILMLYS